MFTKFGIKTVILIDNPTL